MSAYERTICAKFDHVIWVTREDQKAVLGTIAVQSIGKFHPTTLDSEKKQSIIPICYDPIDIVSVDTVPKTKNILFIGGMHWPPNAEGICWFADEIFPEIRRAMPDAQLIAVGKQPPKTLQHASCEIITPGFVEKTEPYWEMSRVFVVPLQAGGGMRVKILDAWARGIPVVSTTIGAEGISYTPEKDILIADNPREFAFKVQKVLQDDELAQQLSINGRKLLQHSYDWRKIYSEWDNVYDTKS